MGLEYTKNVRGSIAAGYSGGGVGMNRDPDNDGSDDRVSVFIRGGEAHRHEGRVTNAAFLLPHQSHYFRSNRAAPQGAEVCITHSRVEGLLRESRGSAFGNNKWIYIQIRPIKKLGRVVGDTVIEVSLLKGRDEVRFDSGGGERCCGGGCC